MKRFEGCVQLTNQGVNLLGDGTQRPVGAQPAAEKCPERLDDALDGDGGPAHECECRGFIFEACVPRWSEQVRENDRDNEHCCGDDPNPGGCPFVHPFPSLPCVSTPGP